MLATKARTHIQELTTHALQHTGASTIIFDTDTPLARILTEAYQEVLPHAALFDIAKHTPDAIIEMLYQLPSDHLVVMIQSSNFRLNEFRIRIFLFERGLKVVEHMHLDRFPEEQWETYIDTLAYDPTYYHPLGHGIRNLLNQAKRTEVRCLDTLLTYDTPFEDPKLNIGDYTATKNTGGTFPIGEVFTEATHLDRVNGECRIFAFAGIDHRVRLYEPFRVRITNGILSATEETPQDFRDILAMIETDEPVHVREFGLGLNPAISKERLLSDITAFERIVGLHLSLGGKHAIYKKPEFKKARTRYHIDVFVDAQEIKVDDHILYTPGAYHLPK